VVAAIRRGLRLFQPSTPYIVIIGALLAGGFFRSLQFTSLNSLAFADLGSSTMSQATSFTSVAQQISVSGGVAVAAIVLETMRYSRGTNEILLGDFAIALFAVGLVSLSALFSIGLPIDAGTSLIRHRRRKRKIPSLNAGTWIGHKGGTMRRRSLRTREL
jgi:hypothetical protein